MFDLRTPLNNHSRFNIAVCYVVVDNSRVTVTMYFRYLHPPHACSHSTKTLFTRILTIMMATGLYAAAAMMMMMMMISLLLGSGGGC